MAAGVAAGARSVFQPHFCAMEAACRGFGFAGWVPSPCRHPHELVCFQEPCPGFVLPKVVKIPELLQEPSRSLRCRGRPEHVGAGAAPPADGAGSGALGLRGLMRLMSTFSFARNQFLSQRVQAAGGAGLRQGTGWQQTPSAEISAVSGCCEESWNAAES